MQISSFLLHNFFPLHFLMGVFIKLVTCSKFNLISCLQFFLSCPLIFFELVSVSLEFCVLSHPLNKICTTPSKYCAVCLSQFALRTEYGPFDEPFRFLMCVDFWSGVRCVWRDGILNNRNPDYQQIGNLNKRYYYL